MSAEAVFSLGVHEADTCLTQILQSETSQEKIKSPNFYGKTHTAAIMLLA